jgi:hypothetical protein
MPVPKAPVVFVKDRIMRTLSLMLPVSLLVLASSTGAQNLPYPKPDAAPMSRVEVTAPANAVRVTSDQARQIKGNYAMSNGWSLEVRTAPRHIEATIDRQPPMRLYAVSPYKFASRDGSVNMQFNLGNWGDDMTMSYRPDPRMAQVIEVSASVAQR